MNGDRSGGDGGHFGEAGKDTFWETGKVLYFDLGSHYLDVYIYKIPQTL